MQNTTTDRKKRVLLAEDNVINQKVALRQVQKLGYDAEAVGNGAEALKAIEAAAYDLVLMDCQMPVMDGYEATRQIRRLQAGAWRIPIIALTAHAMVGEREKCLAADMDDYLAKPLKLEELAAMIKKWLARNAAESGQETADTAAPPVDLSQLTEALGDEEEEIREILGLYLEQMSESIPQLDAAIESQDARKLKSIAHSCAGVSANCGMVRVVGPLRDLEQLGDAKNLDGARDLTHIVASEFDRIKVYLRENMPQLAVI
jgi:CheY-like chemotaxis protein/HPt (histidine-containing phosphotransfer) domain-containing protein